MAGSNHITEHDLSDIPEEEFLGLTALAKQRAQSERSADILREVSAILNERKSGKINSAESWQQ